MKFQIYLTSFISSVYQNLYLNIYDEKIYLEII